jgi:hypothetical protein
MPSNPSSSRRSSVRNVRLSVAGASSSAETPRLDRGAERRELPRVEGLEVGVDRGQLEVRVGTRVAMTGEVLRARGDASALQAADERGDVPRDELRVSAEGPDADDRVLGVRVDVCDRSEVETDADFGEIRSKR